MNIFFLSIALGMCFLMLFSLYRAIFGPTVLDRLVGVNAIGSKTVILLLLIGFLYERVDMFVDIALAYAFLNFVAVIAASRYFHKRKGLYEESFMD
ncbi:MAG: pH regulation protein F [Desulfobacteraceae bacterium]|nr:pH regulation protein F [Desulfobacteraceae bacterium]